MTLVTFNAETGELLDYATVPTSPTAEYAREFLDEFNRAPTLPADSEASKFMDEVRDALHRKGFC